MRANKWRDIAELIGIAAIVAPLIFVHLEMRQSREIALAEIYQARTATIIEWHDDMAGNELALSAIWFRLSVANYQSGGNGIPYQLSRFTLTAPAKRNRQ